MLSVIAGLDRADPTSLSVPVPDYRAALRTSLGGLRIGVDEIYVSERVDEEVYSAFADAMGQLERLGARIVPLPMPSPKRVLDGWALICGPETALAHRGNYPEKADQYGPELSGIIDIGRGTSAMDMAAALEDRLDFCGAMKLLFDQVDVLAMPTLPVRAPLASEFLSLLEDDSVALGRYTIPPNVTGHPAISLPCGMDGNGHPIGLQLVARHCDEQALFDAAHAFQSVTDWHVRHPELKG
jgi:amidase